MPSNQQDIVGTFGLDISPAQTQINNFTRSLKPISLKANFPLGQMGRDANDFGRSIAAAQTRVLSFAATASQLYVVSRAFTAIVKSTIDVEKQLRDINVVLGLSSRQLSTFSNDLFKAANLTGQGFDIAAKAAIEFSRQGLSVNETLKRTTDALTLVRFSGIDAGKAVESLTAVLNGFNDAGLDSTKIINKLISIDQSFAISAGGLAEALSRTSSVAKDSGVGLNELLGVITAAKQITGRDAPVIGNAIKTIFQRVQRTEVLDNLKQLGVLTEDYNGNALNSLQILSNLAKVYNTLSASQRNAVTQLASGVLQANQFKAILSDLAKPNSITSRATTIAIDANDQAARRQEELNKTLAANINETINNLQNFASRAGQITLEPVIKTLTNGAFGINNIVKNFGNFGKEGTEANGASLGEGMLKGLGNYLSGPGLALSGILIARFVGGFASFASKSIAQIIEGSSSAFKIQEATTALLSRQPQLYGQIAALGNDQVKINALINRELQNELILLNQIAAANAKIALNTNSGFLNTFGLGNQKQYKLNPKDELSINPRFKSVGHIPETQEKIGAYVGGYTPGQVKELNIPNLGRVIYNTAEKVKYFPGLSQPAIIPPQASKAGINYNKSFIAQHGFSPYQSQGLVPNFALSPYLHISNQLFDKFQIAQAAKISGGGKSYGIGHYFTQQPNSFRHIKGDYLYKAELDQSKFFNPDNKLSSTIEDLFVQEFRKKFGANVDDSYLREKLNNFKRGALHSIGFNDSNSEVSNLFTSIGLTGANLNTREHQSIAYVDDVVKLLGREKNPYKSEGVIPNYAAAIKAAALLYNGEIFEGGMHAFAFEKLKDKYPTFDQSKIKSGFTTNDGRFLNRHEAFNLHASNDWNYAADMGNRRNWLDAMDLNLPHASKGRIPNFSALSDAISRERAAGVSLSQIRVGASPLIKSNFNPLGLGVYNTKDEPLGLSQGIARAASLGLNPKTHGLPNFAKSDLFTGILGVGENVTNRLDLRILNTKINDYKLFIESGLANQKSLNKATISLANQFLLGEKAMTAVYNAFQSAIPKIRLVIPFKSEGESQRFSERLKTLDAQISRVRDSAKDAGYPNLATRIIDNTNPLLNDDFSKKNPILLGAGINSDFEKRRIRQKAKQLSLTEYQGRTYKAEGIPLVEDIIGIKKNSQEQEVEQQSRQNEIKARIEASKARAILNNEAKIKDQIVKDIDSRLNKIGLMTAILRPDKYKKALNFAESQDGFQQASNKRQDIANKGLLTGFALSITGGAIEQAIGAQYGESQGGRVAARLAGAAGNIGSYAAQGLAFGPYGAIAGGVLGLVTELPSVFKAFSDTLPDLQRNLEKLKETSQKTSVNLQSYVQTNEAINDRDTFRNLRPSQQALLQSQRVSSIVNLPYNLRAKLRKANLEGNTDIYGLADIGQATGQQNVNLAQDTLIARKDFQDNYGFTSRLGDGFKALFNSGAINYGISLPNALVQGGFDLKRRENPITHYKDLLKIYQDKKLNASRENVDPIVKSILGLVNENGQNAFQTFNDKDIQLLQAASSSDDVGKLRTVLQKILIRRNYGSETRDTVDKFLSSGEGNEGGQIIAQSFKDASKADIFQKARDDVKKSEENNERLRIVFSKIEESLNKLAEESEKVGIRFETSIIKRFSGLSNKIDIGAIIRESGFKRTLLAAGDSPYLSNYLNYRSNLGKANGIFEKQNNSIEENFQLQASKIARESYEKLVKSGAESIEKNKLYGSGQVTNEAFGKLLEFTNGQNNPLFNLSTDNNGEITSFDAKSGAGFDSDSIRRYIEYNSSIIREVGKLNDTPQPFFSDAEGLLKSAGKNNTKTVLQLLEEKNQSTGFTRTNGGIIESGEGLPQNLQLLLKGLKENPTGLDFIANAKTPQEISSRQFLETLAAQTKKQKLEENAQLRLLDEKRQAELSRNRFNLESTNSSDLASYNEDNIFLGQQYAQNRSSLRYQDKLGLNTLQLSNQLNRRALSQRAIPALNTQFDIQKIQEDATVFSDLQKQSPGIQVNSRSGLEKLLSEKLAQQSQFKGIENFVGPLTEDQQGNLNTYKQINDEIEKITAAQDKLNSQDDNRTERLKEQKYELELQLKFTQGILDNTRRINQRAAAEGRYNDIDFKSSFVEPLQTSTSQFWDDMDKDIQSFGINFKQSFKDGFKDAIINGKSAGDVIKGIFTNIAASFTSKLADRSMDLVFASLFGTGQGGGSVFGGGNSGYLGSLFSNIGSSFSQKKANGGLINKYASGGFVNMGSGVKDDVPALLSGGEFVLNKKAVQRIGKHNLDRINFGKSRKFASGGNFLNPLEDQFSGAISSSSINATPTSATIALANTFEVNSDASKGWFNTSPLLSSRALTDRNNPQNALKFKREQYIYQKKQYNDQIAKQLKEWQDQHDTQAIMGLVSAVISSAGMLSQVKVSKSYANSFVNNGANQSLMTQYVTQSPFSYNTFRPGTNLTLDGFANGGLFGAESSSDKYPAMIMGGEYVVNPKTVSSYGVNYFNSLNRGYANGGLVGGNTGNPSIDLNSNFSKLIEVSTQIRDNLSKNDNTKSNNANKESGGVNNYVNITVTMQDNGKTESKSDASSTGDKKSKFNQEDATKLGKMIESKVVEVLSREAKPNGFLSDKFEKRKT